MPLSYPYIQYGGIWTTSQATDAVAAGTWAVPPAPHLLVWGYNASGQLGLGNTTSYSSPKQVGPTGSWSSTSVGSYGSNGVSMVVRSDGTLWACGINTYGQLGLGNTTAYSSPKQVGALTNWAEAHCEIFCLATHAIKTDGTLWSWGVNNYGGLGLGNVTYYSSPKQVGALTNWSKVASNGYRFAAVKTDGTLWTCGANFFGELGLGNTTSYSSPKQVGALTNWSNVSTGQNYVLATKTDGTLWSWGYNPAGQLGLGNTTYYSSPKQVGVLTNWLKISCGNYTASTIKTDGTLWSWGRNTYGELGVGDTTNRSSPIQVGALTDWLQVSTGSNSTLAIKTNGTLWSWGYGAYGTLGLGNTTNYSSPKQVGSNSTWTRINCNGGYSAMGVATV